MRKNSMFNDINFSLVSSCVTFFNHLKSLLADFFKYDVWGETNYLVDN